MKNIIIGASFLVIGIVMGLLFRPKQTDEKIITKIEYKTKYYSSLELQGKTYKIDVPEIGVQKYIYVAVDSVSVIYKDSIQYVMLPREYYRTNIDDVEIFHSGIDSKIDSLKFSHKTEVVTNKIRPTAKRNNLELGIEADYCTSFSLPVYIEYERMVRKNIGIKTSLYYDMRVRQWGLLIGTSLQFAW